MHNIDLTTLNGGSTISGSLRAHTQAYLCLRDIVRHHQASGATPHLQESPKPISGYQVAIGQEGELSRLIQENAEFVRKQENREFVENLENLLILERENPDMFQDMENSSE